MCAAAVTKIGDPDPAKPAVRTLVIWGIVSRSNPGGVAARTLVARCGYGLRARARTDRVGLHRLRGRRCTSGGDRRESTVAAAFIIVAAVAVTASPWLLVVGVAGHRLKDLWQHRRDFVKNTRWWPPFCLVLTGSRPRSSQSKSSPASTSTNVEAGRCGVRGPWISSVGGVRPAS
jgi:hypothetical protein